MPRKYLDQRNRPAEVLIEDGWAQIYQIGEGRPNEACANQHHVLPFRKR